MNFRLYEKPEINSRDKNLLCDKNYSNQQNLSNENNENSKK